VLDSEETDQRRLPFWLWLVLALLYLILASIIAGILGELFSWPQWVANVIRGGSFGLLAVVGGPRITHAKRAAQERRASRRNRRV